MMGLEQVGAGQRRSIHGWHSSITAHGERFERRVGPYVMSVYRSGSAWRWCVTLTHSQMDGLAATAVSGTVAAKGALESYLKTLIAAIDIGVSG